MRNLLITIGLIILCLNSFSQSLSDYLPNRPMVGKEAPIIDIDQWIYPNIRIEDWEVKKVPTNLEGRVIVLDFWFTKCAPCVASIPELNFLARKFPEILFLSISFDEEPLLTEFLDKMIMLYPVGSDPERKIINEYGVIGYPETFLIDSNGIIQWQGSPFRLNERLLNEALGRKEMSSRIKVSRTEVPYDNSAYTFTIQEHNLEMGRNSYSHTNPFDINVFNRNLVSMLKSFYGINKPRIISNDANLFDTNYDLSLKADMEITTKANSVEILKYLLPIELGFEMSEINKDTLVNIIKIENDSVLNLSESSSEFFGTTMRFDNWEATGATIENLKDFIENEYQLLTVTEYSDDTKFDFILPVNDWERAKEILYKDYGLLIEKDKRTTTFWEINKLRP